MLQSMRHLAQSWVFKGLMILLVASFGIWGIGDMFRGNPLKRVVAKAGEDTITVQDMNHAFEIALQRIRQNFGPDITAQQAKQMGLAGQTLNDLIETSLFEQDLKRLGVEADDRAVFRVLTDDAQFKDKDGKFDKSILQNLLAQNHISEGEFLSQQRKALAGRQLVGVFSAQPTPPSSLIEELYKARGEQHIFDVLTLANSSINVTDTPDDKVLRDFYQAKPQAFTKPETRGVTIAILSTEAIAKDITISDDQVKKEYDSRGDQLKEPETRDLLQVVVQEEDKAKEISAAAKASGSLASAAKPTGHEVMPLNQMESDNLFPELAKPVFALPVNGISDPIKTDLGWHIIQVRKITPAGIPPFDTIKEKLRETIKNDQASDVATRTINQLDDDLAAGRALEDIADGMKLRMIKIPSVDPTGKTADGKDPAELPYKDDVLKQAFSQNSGETSPVMDDKNGSYFVVRTDNVTPSALKPFDSVKSDVIEAWRKDEQIKRVAAEAETIAKALREGKEASSFATHAGVDIRVSKPISMLGDTDPEMPRTIIPQILKLKKGEVTVLPQEGKQMIVRLASIVPAKEPIDEATEGKLKTELTEAGRNELADQYARYLRVIFPVTIHQDALESIGQQGGS